jgi:hypothetical protein
VPQPVIIQQVAPAKKTPVKKATAKHKTTRRRR